MDDFDSVDGEYYNDDDDCDSADSAYDEYNYGADDDMLEEVDVAKNKFDKKPQNYTILSEGDILKRQEESINRVSTELYVSESWASLLLRRFQWSVDRVRDEWFLDDEKVRKIVGLVENSTLVVKETEKVACFICLESCCYEETHAAMCGHRYCTDCWKGYIDSAINDGPGCLSLRCPDPDCWAVVEKELIAKLVSDEYRKKYDQYIVRSYVEDNRRTKWCPAPGCDFAVDFVTSEDGDFNVSCRCSHEFCYNCIEERHRPVNCDTVSKWLIKNSSESENTNWILANSKPCPKCKRNIEKNQGCNHMTCNQQCGYHFCWLCLGDWKEHKGYYTCNAYEAEKQNGTINEAELKRGRAKQSLEKYTHYFERWSGNNKSMLKAADNLNDFRKTHLPFLLHKMLTTDMQVKCIPEAWLQIIECRRVLKWTYAYGYYLPEHDQTQKQFFELMQGQAEYALEKLHKCAETDMLVFLKDDKEETKTDEKEMLFDDKEKTKTNEKQMLFKEFKNFMIKLEELTKANKNHFDNLVTALENGLSDVYHGAVVENKNKNKQEEKPKRNKLIYEGPDGFTYSTDEDD